MSAKTAFGFLLIVITMSVAACQSVNMESTETQTGIDVVDNVITTILSGDVAQQRELLVFRPVICTSAKGLGGLPPCEDGEVEGTQVEVFPILESEGHFLRKEKLDIWQGISASKLFAVYRVSTSVYRDEIFPAGDYAALFTTEGDQVNIVVHISTGGIVRLDYKYSDSPKDILEREAENVILKP